MKNRIKTIFVLLAMVVVSNGFAQDNKPTKEETIEFIESYFNKNILLRVILNAAMN